MVGGQWDEESVMELSLEVGREGNVWGEEMAPSLKSCARCVLLTASRRRLFCSAKQRDL